jgi:uroporphyrinogen-III synthase
MDFLNTRAKSKDNYLDCELSKLGHSLRNLPMIEIQSSVLKGFEISQLKNLTENAHVVFTSKNGVKYFFEYFKESNLRLPENLKFCCIASKTEKYLNSLGFKSYFTGSGNTSDDFIEELKESDIKGKLLLALGNLAPNTIQNELSHKFEISRVNIYQTVEISNFPKDIVDKIVSKHFRAIIFNSPSAVRVFHQKIDLINNHTCISIGTKTEAYINSLNHKSIFVANPSTEEGILEGVKNFVETS